MTRKTIKPYPEENKNKKIVKHNGGINNNSIKSYFDLPNRNSNDVWSEDVDIKNVSNSNNNNNHNNNKMKRKNSIVKLAGEIELEDISEEIISLNEEDEMISKKIKKDKKNNKPINLNIQSLENKENNIENKKIFSFTSPKNKINHIF
jgi:hypothetical protein